MRRPSRMRAAMGASNAPLALSYSGFSMTATATVGGTATETTLLGTGSGSLTLPANFLTVGKTLRVTARGIVSTQLVPTTLNLRWKLGSTVMGATGDITTVASLANRFWMIDGLATCRTTGSGGTVFAQSLFMVMALSSGQGVATHWEMTNTAATSVDTTGSLAIGLTADWGGTVTGDSTISCTHFAAEVLN